MEAAGQVQPDVRAIRAAEAVDPDEFEEASSRPRSAPKIQRSYCATSAERQPAKPGRS